MLNIIKLRIHWKFQVKEDDNPYIVNMGDQTL